MADNKSNPYLGAARAGLGQGLGMGWGDEAEAWLRAKSGQGSYEDNLKRIRQEYGQYAGENPFTAGAAEFTGGALPGVGMMMLPGGQGAGAAQLGRSTMGALGRLGLMGAGTGAVAGAGTATEGERGSGAISGGAVGGMLGVALPLGMRAGSSTYNWLRGRLFPTEELAQKTATGKMSKAMTESKMSPKDIEQVMAADKAMGIPGVAANVNPALTDLAKAVAQRTGEGTRKIEKTILEQRLGSRERTQQQVTKALKPGDYYDDLAKLQQDLRTKAAPHYEAAYSYGEVTDPKVLEFMKLPQFQKGLKEAEGLLAAEGRKMPTIPIMDEAGNKVGEKVAPTVEVLDQVKRGLDSLIEKETDAVTGKSSSLGRIYTQKKNEFLGALDEAVPEYATARAVYRGDAELMDAMRKGINEFGKLDHEQVIKMVAKMSDGEKDAFRTGVTRDLYDKIMKPSGNFNAAQRLIGSPEMQAKLQPLFNNPAEFQLFKNALERESQLFQQSNKILGGSETAKNLIAREKLDEVDGLGGAIVEGVAGGWKNSLANMAISSMRKGQMNEDMTSKLANMLMAKDPHEVAAVVKLLEQYQANAIPKAVRASAAEAGAVTGTSAAIAPPPEATMTQPGIESDTIETPASTGPSIEDDIARLMSAEPAK